MILAICAFSCGAKAGWTRNFFFDFVHVRDMKSSHQLFPHLFFLLLPSPRLSLQLIKSNQSIFFHKIANSESWEGEPETLDYMTLSPKRATRLLILVAQQISNAMGGDSTATPAQIAEWEAEPLLPPESFADKFSAVKNYFARGPKAFMFGSYSYSYLCMPTFFPWKKGGNKVSIKQLEFLGNDFIIFLAIAMSSHSTSL